MDIKVEQEWKLTEKGVGNWWTEEGAGFSIIVHTVDHDGCGTEEYTEDQTEAYYISKRAIDKGWVELVSTPPHWTSSRITYNEKSGLFMAWEEEGTHTICRHEEKLHCQLSLVLHSQMLGTAGSLREDIKKLLTY